jgi:hypothetical protein
MKNLYLFVIIAITLAITLALIGCSTATEVFTGPGNSTDGDSADGDSTDWDGALYTVTFDPDGGSGEIRSRTVASGGVVGISNMPAEPVKTSHIFGGWYTARNGGGDQFTGTTTVSGTMTVYAKWMASVDLSLEAALAWISANAEDGGGYTITVQHDEAISAKTLSYGRKTVSITLVGAATERTVDLSGSGSLFTVGDKVTLTLDDLTLRGRADNTASLVKVQSGGKLEMKNSSKITGNTNISSIVGGVFIDGGTFTMSGGEISGNAADLGGGVLINGGTFTMSGGEISGNTTDTVPGRSSFSHSGGGVWVSGHGTFTLSGGKISGNTAARYGGGVYVYTHGIFTMNGGEISGNTSSFYSSYYSFGGWVHIYSYGTFTMSGGKISGNIATNGGGVGIFGNGTFTMQDGEISGNITSNNGGGVSIYGRGTFAMSGGEISDNTADLGGGVYVYSNNETFTKQGGGTIYGTDASVGLKNTAAISGHAAVLVHLGGSKRRATTAGPGVNLDNTKTGAEGGWE